MWLNCLIVSFAFPLVMLILPFVINKSKLAKEHKVSHFNLLFAGVFVAAVLMFYPIHRVTTEAAFSGAVRAVLLSLFTSMQVFTIGCEFSVVADSAVFCPDALDTVYRMWAALLYVVAPVFTFGFVLSLFKNISAYLKYMGSYFNDVYVFSELNERALTLAEDIKSKHKKAVIIFTDVFEDNEESSYELLESAKKIGAICFKKDMLVINFKRHSARKPISFLAIGNDEAENLNQSLKLIENYKSRKETHIYVFSSKIESELLLASVDKGELKVRRINEVQSLVNRILYEQGEVVFDNAKETDGGDKLISVVVIGMGNHGKEMVKALSWYCQMDGYKLEINAFDKDPLAEEKFVALAPELMSAQYNGVDVEGEAQYKITVHPGVDVQSITFADKLSQITDATYAFIALGNDDVNINTAVSVRMYFERMNIHPVIHAVVYNSQQKNALDGIKNYRGQPYDIEFVGDMESSYTEDVILDSELENEALNRHLKWGNEDEFWSYEYNYRSSMASAIHMKARIKCSIPGAAKKEDELTSEERRIIEILEHRRWNAYMRAEGYVFSGSRDKSSRNDLAKMHHDLVSFSSLVDEEKCKDSKVGSK